MSNHYAKISGEYDNRHAAYHTEQVATGDNEEQIANHNREWHHREQTYEDHSDDPGILMLDPVEQQLYVVSADEDNGAKEGQSRNCNHDVAYWVRADTTKGYPWTLGRTHSSLNIIYINDLVHVSLYNILYYISEQLVLDSNELKKSNN